LRPESGRSQNLLSAILALIAAAQAQPTPPIMTTPETPIERVFTPREAVLGAADTAPRPLPGYFVMFVRRTGREGDRVYLNSEADYRDQRNLTISIDPGAVRELTGRYGTPPDQYLRGRLIVVSGAARRTQIDIFGEGGRRTGLYYFQTQVPVRTADQVQFLLSSPGRITSVR
jgi:hypothetical protein